MVSAAVLSRHDKCSLRRGFLTCIPCPEGWPPGGSGRTARGCGSATPGARPFTWMRPLPGCPWSAPGPLPPRPPPRRVLELAPADGVPYRLPGTPLDLIARAAGVEERLVAARPLQLLERLRHLLESGDPDLLLTDWGDDLLLPGLVALAGTYGVGLPP